MTQIPRRIHVGVLALQGAFSEHIQLLKKAFVVLEALPHGDFTWTCAEIRTSAELATCDALIIPGGESTAISLVAARSELLDLLRIFVKYQFLPYLASARSHLSRVNRKPTWGTCAGLILLAEAANRTKKGGQDLIGGIDVRVNRNHFGRQMESFEMDINLPFLNSLDIEVSSFRQRPFRGIFIRAPIVEKILPQTTGVHTEEEQNPGTVVAPSRMRETPTGIRYTPVEIMATLPGRRVAKSLGLETSCDGDIIAVRQRNVFGTSFHPELTDDARIHVWWLMQISTAFCDPVGR